MRKICGKVTETIVLVKEVEIEVPDECEDGEIEDVIRKKAYEKALTDLDIKEKTGWEGADTLEVEIDWKERV